MMRKEKRGGGGELKESEMEVSGLSDVKWAPLRVSDTPVQVHPAGRPPSTWQSEDLRWLLRAEIREGKEREERKRIRSKGLRLIGALTGHRHPCSGAPRRVASQHMAKRGLR
jgi:hypothetical protein